MTTSGTGPARPRESAESVVRRLCLAPHPEGGWFREIHRSSAMIGKPPGYTGARCALTVIQFLLTEGDFSAFHSVRSEEVWVHLDGAPIELATLAESLSVRILAPASAGGEPLAVVAPGCLQAGTEISRTTGGA